MKQVDIDNLADDAVVVLDGKDMKEFFNFVQVLRTGPLPERVLFEWSCALTNIADRATAVTQPELLDWLGQQVKKKGS